MDLNDDSMPVPDVAPVSRRTRLSLALASMLPPASGTSTRHGRGTGHLGGHDPACPFADEHEWDDEYDASTDDEHDDSNYVLFDEDDGDGIGADAPATRRHAAARGRKQWRYEARLNGMIPPPAHFCCRPVFF